MDNTQSDDIKTIVTLVIIVSLLFIFMPSMRKAATISPMQLGQMQQKLSTQEFSTTQEGAKTIPVSSYSMQPLDKNLANYLNNNGYASKAQLGKKMVIYTNVTDLQCPYQDAMLKDIRGYASHPDWTKKYDFIENPQKKKTVISGNTQEEYNANIAFVNNCQIFCIIDFDKQTMFVGKKKGDSQYLYSVLAAFYN